MIKTKTDEAQLKAAVALVSERYAEGADVVTAAFAVAEEYGVSASEILSRMGQRGGNVAARNRRRVRQRPRPIPKPSVERSDAESDASAHKDEEE